jgi:integrase
VPKATRSRIFIPTPEEVADLIKRADPDFALLCRAAAITAMRYGEIAHLEVGDLDPEKGVLNVRVSKTGPRELLLSSTAMKFFAEQAKGKLPRARLLTSQGTPWSPSMQSRRMRRTIDNKAFVFYSLRAYAISRQLSAGIPSSLVARNAGTSEAMIRSHYHRWIRDDDRALFDRVDKVLA